MITSLEEAKRQLDSFYEQKNQEGEFEIRYAQSYLDWIKEKTWIITMEKNFKVPDWFQIKRGSVFWIKFGHNIAQEFGGKHPGIVIKKGGGMAIVVPLSSQEPTEKQKASGIFVEIERVYGFRPQRRWVNVLNTMPVSIQRFDFSSPNGNVKGRELDKIAIAIQKLGLWKITDSNKDSL